MDRLPLLAAAALGSAILAASHVQAVAADAGRGALLRVADLSLGETLKAAIAAGAANTYSQDAPQTAPVPAASAEATPPAIVSVPPPLVMPSAEVEAPVAVAQPARDIGAETPRATAEPSAATAVKHHHSIARAAHHAAPEKADRVAATPMPKSPAPKAEAAFEPASVTPKKAAPVVPALAKAVPVKAKPVTPTSAAKPATVAKVAPKPAAPEPAKAVPVKLEPATAATEAAAPPAPAVQARFSDADADAARPLAIDTLPSPPEDVAAIPAIVTPAAATGAAAAAAPPAKRPTRVATLESGIEGRARAEPALTLSFTPGSTGLSQESRDTLQRFARTFAAHPGRLEITAYANSGDGSAAGARRLSLKRALAVREVLLGQGVAATRMDVRALGGSGAAAGGDPNRLELTVEGAQGKTSPNGRSGGG
jgi:outer membrane protein OmpA-like peptidoglycan-associated protein